MEVLQTSALPLGYGASCECEAKVCRVAWCRVKSQVADRAGRARTKTGAVGMVCFDVCQGSGRAGADGEPIIVGEVSRRARGRTPARGGFIENCRASSP